MTIDGNFHPQKNGNFWRTVTFYLTKTVILSFSVWNNGNFILDSCWLPRPNWPIFSTKVTVLAEMTLFGNTSKTTVIYRTKKTPFRFGKHSKPISGPSSFFQGRPISVRTNHFRQKTFIFTPGPSTFRKPVVWNFCISKSPQLTRFSVRKSGDTGKNVSAMNSSGSNYPEKVK